jgi:hypothetical protein
MNPAAELDSLITRFVAGEAFYDFWKAFMDFYEALDDSVLSPEQRGPLGAVVRLGLHGSARIPRRRLSVSSASSASRKMRERLRNFRVGGYRGFDGNATSLSRN